MATERMGDGGHTAEIEAVIALMAVEPLCPSFLGLVDGPEDTPYEGAARVAVRNPEWTRSDSRDAPEWLDGDPIYPDRPNARRFFGNFAHLSRVFTIDTDNEAEIARLREAIAANMASEAFKAARGAA